jgi:hypothetical protein
MTGFSHLCGSPFLFSTDGTMMGNNNQPGGDSELELSIKEQKERKRILENSSISQGLTAAITVQKARTVTKTIAFSRLTGRRASGALRCSILSSWY